MTILFVGLSLLLVVICWTGIVLVLASRAIKNQFRIPLIAVIVIAVFLIWLGIYKIMLIDKSGSDDEEKQYWRTKSSGMVHNYKCRWYGTSNGEWVSATSGDRDCSICGGSN